MTGALRQGLRPTAKLAVLFIFIMNLRLGSLAIEGPFAQFDYEAVKSLKTLPLEKIFTDYKTALEFQSRTDAARLQEMLSRSNLLDFVTAKIKKSRAELDTLERNQAREKAVHIVGKMGPRAKPAVPLLIECLEDDDNIRHRVTNALVELGPTAAEAKPALLEELHFRNHQAARALFKINPTSLEIFQAVTAAVSDTSEDPGFRTQTIEAFYECNIDPATVRSFLENLIKENKSNWIAETAKRQLNHFDWQTARQPRAGPTFLNGQFPATSDPGASSDHAALLDRLKSNPDDHPTAQALSKLPSSIRLQAVEILLTALRQNKVRFPSNTISMLSLFGEDAAAALPLLLQFADSDNSGLANNSMSALGEIGPAALEAKPIVERALEDGNALLRWRAANTLCSIDADNFDSHLEHLIDLIRNDTQREYSDFAIRTLGRFGPRAAKATPFLLEKLNDDKFRLAVADALCKIADDSATKSKIATAIARDLKHNSIYSRDNAARPLGELGPHARVALPALEEAAKSDDSEFAKIAGDSIAKIENKKE